MPPWAAAVVRNRELFDNTVLGLEDKESGTMEYLAFNWASHQPFVLSTQKIRLLENLPSTKEGDLWQDALEAMGRVERYIWERDMSPDTNHTQPPASLQHQ